MRGREAGFCEKHSGRRLSSASFRPKVRGKRVYERPQPLHAAPSGVLLAWKHLHAKRDPRPADEERVVVVARASRLHGVVPESRPFLMAVDGLDGVVDVEDETPAERRYVHRAPERLKERFQPVFTVLKHISCDVN